MRRAAPRLLQEAPVVLSPSGAKQGHGGGIQHRWQRRQGAAMPFRPRDARQGSKDKRQGREQPSAASRCQLYVICH